MRGCFVLIFFYVFCFPIQAQKTVIYLLPGIGSDSRIYDSLHFDSERFIIKNVVYKTPAKQDNMASFAKTLLTQIDTTSKFILIGTSLGGMLSVELSEICTPQKVILISSAKNRNDLPPIYKMQREFRLYKIVPAFIYKLTSRPMQKLVEPDRRKYGATFSAMLKAKKPLYLKRTAGLIMKWERGENRKPVIQIHGTNDHTLPFRNIQNSNFSIKNGSHMMTLTAFKEVQIILDIILKD
jgi:pimeloyl-ACP methyl ester carboxylesterase